MSAHWFLAGGMLGMAVAIFWLGWAASIMWREWKDDKALRAAEVRYERHTHRKGDPQETVLLPRAGHLALIDPPPEMRASSQVKPPCLFAGEQLPGWAAEAAEYELLHQTAERPGVSADDLAIIDQAVRHGVAALNEAAALYPHEDDWQEDAMTAEFPASVTGEPPIDTGELLAITDRVEAWIAGWAAQGNYDRHTIQGSS